MRVKSRTELEQKASFIVQDLERNYRPCETLCILSEVAKILSLVMLLTEQEDGS
jgi:hypothetical protein